MAPTLIAPAANALWLLSQAPEYLRFLSAASAPNLCNTQNTLLRTYLSRNAGTEFGRSHGFARMAGPEAYARAVPIRDWRAMQTWVDRAACGTPSVLTQDAVLRLEPTSGSTSAAKFIPVTSELRREFSRGVSPWMCSLFKEHPTAFSGTAYWSISPPAMEPPVLPGAKIPVGHARDSDYLDPISAWLFRSIMAVPETVAAQAAPEAFYLETLSRLLSDPRLSLVSVWSPTFLLQLDRRLRVTGDSVLRHAVDGKWMTRSRLRFVEKAMRPGFNWKGLWPKLAVVSCWTHAQSSMWIARVREVLGEIPIHPKGLMSTEGVTSIPVTPDLDPCLAIRSHYFEFLPEGGDRALQAHEVERGHSYEIILTTGGGLYRYRTGDLVAVTGLFKSAPCFRFVGRLGGVTDLVGEKVSEIHAQQALEKIPAPPFPLLTAFFYPHVSTQGKVHYTLHLELAAPAAHASLPPFSADAARSVEASLGENPYYRQARNLGQLEAARVEFLKPGSSLRLADFVAATSGARAGVTKVPLLFQARSLTRFLQDHP